jgi:hypothetical protein
LLRDLSAPLSFRQVPMNPTWRRATVVALARTIYEERTFDRLANLADALEEAGCRDADVRGHGREPGKHVRCCWAVDWVLRKS